jgi:hypothetical protein
MRRTRVDRMPNSCGAPFRVLQNLRAIAPGWLAGCRRRGFLCAFQKTIQNLSERFHFDIYLPVTLRPARRARVLHAMRDHTSLCTHSRLPIRESGKPQSANPGSPTPLHIYGRQFARKIVLPVHGGGRGSRISSRARVQRPNFGRGRVVAGLHQPRVQRFVLLEPPPPLLLRLQVIRGDGW